MIIHALIYNHQNNARHCHFFLALLPNIKLVPTLNLKIYITYLNYSYWLNTQLERMESVNYFIHLVHFCPYKTLMTCAYIAAFHLMLVEPKLLQDQIHQSFVYVILKFGPYYNHLNKNCSSKHRTL